MDERDDPKPDTYSRLHDPLRGTRERWISRLNWWQKTLVLVGLFVVVVAGALIATLASSR